MQKSEMITICCTAKLLKRSGFHPQPVTPDSTTALGNWHANLLYISRVQLLLFVSDNSRLAVITPAREARSMASHLTDQLKELLGFLAVPPDWIEAEIREMAEVHYSTTRSRSILGTMNDFKFQIEVRSEYSGIVDPFDLSLELNQIPVGPLEYGFPEQAALELLRKRYDTGQLPTF